jgi:ribosomal protein S13
MRYNEIIGLHDYFQPAYDLTNEVGTYWKQFIPNKKFFDALVKTLNSIESGNPDESKSLWLQGAYGTGKSHATAVIKHLLYDAWGEVGDYIENLEDTQLKFRLKTFREGKKAFPVVLYGTSSIVDNRTFALVMERAVKNELKKEGIEISTKSDFEKLIYQIQENPANIDWQKNIEDSELRLYVSNKEGLIAKLREEDIKILRILEDTYSKNDLHFLHSDISDWLVEVRDELKEKGIADALMIYWDEFTGMLELPKSGLLLTELQNIAELSINKDVYLFVVCHRNPAQTSIAKDDMGKVRGRFKILDYFMEPITTYHIINASIRKKDKNRWEELKNKQIDDVKPLIQTIIVNEDVKVQRYIEDLFPIHPYTAYLSTFIARHIGSTERSIFQFLYDEEKGFRKFINSNPDTDGNVFLTVDYLWDFFYEEFERIGNEKFSPALERFKLHKQILEGNGSEYLAIFKGILLLNILHKVVNLSESSLVTPAIDNRLVAI